MSKIGQGQNLRFLVGVPEGSPEIVVDGVSLAVARAGKGPPIVCLHAIGHGGRDFEAFTNAVKDRFEVVRIDWPGQGRSGPDSRQPTPKRYAELLDGILTQLRIANPIIIGNSIGGATAIVYASTHPVRALVLCDSGGIFEVTPALRRLCGLFARFFDAGARGAWWYRRAFAFYYRIVLPSPAAAPQRRRIIAAAYEIAAVLRDAWGGFALPEADMRDLAVALDMPVWFAWAKSDRVIPLSYAKPVIAKMKRARLTRFRGGHAAFLERPKQFNREFLKFAASLNRERASLAQTK
ncbi:MAG: alpha/beta fold hydrolase [Alphaproteobacteria bacterium]|nr:alpha/beta fold hydrolase [Alphaproteobacteria bacterium]